MNKLFTKIAALSVGLAMAVGVGVAVASDSNEASPVQAAVPSVGTTNYSLLFSNIGSTGWTNSYANHSYTASDDVVISMNASKQTSTITDKPVTKGQPVTLVLPSNPGVYISGFTFTAKQWGSKAQTITAHYSTDGGSTYTALSGTSTNFSITKSSLNNRTNAIKITFSSASNQVGLASFSVTYAAASTPLTGITLGGAASNNALSIGSSDFAAKTVSVTLNPTSATDQKVNIAHQSGTSGLFTVSSSATCTSGAGSFTVTGKGNTSGSETFRISGNTESSVYVDLVVTAFDDSVTYWTVSFDTDGGSATINDMSVEDGDTFEFPSPGTKEHYTFDGWSADAEHFYDEGDTSPAVDDDIEYLAFWTEDAKYTVTYVAGENGSGTYAHTDNYGGTYTLLAFANVTDVSASSGYRFKNYTVGGVDKNPGDTFTLSAATLVTVNFEELPPTDTLTANIIGQESYGDWSGKSGGGSDAVYAGNSTKSSNGAIQMRSNNSNSGIVTTTSGGTIKAVTVTWNTADQGTNARTLDVYAKTTAYSAATDLYSNSTQGTKVGSISYTNTTTYATTLSITGDYTYVGVRSNSGALYLTNISFEWELPNELSSIVLSGEYKTSFASGDTFSFGGTVTAKYTKASDANVTNSATFHLDSANGTNMSGVTMTHAAHDGHTIYAKYTENDITKTATYEISVANAPVSSVSIGTHAAEIGLEEEYSVSGITPTVLPADAVQTTEWVAASNTVSNDFTFNGTKLTAGQTEGTVTLRCRSTADNSKYDELVVTISGDPVAAFAKESTTGFAGKSETVSFTYGNFDAEDIAIETGNNSYVTIGAISASEGNGTVVINFVAAGSTSVTIGDGNSVLDTLTVTVSADSVTSVTWSASDIDVFSGATLSTAGWNVQYEMASGDTGSAESYTIKLGSATVTAGYEFQGADNGKTLHVEYGGVSSSSVNVVVTQTINNVNADIYTENNWSHELSAKTWSTAGSQTLNGKSWTMAGEDDGTGYMGWDATKGQQYGSGSHPYTSITLSSSGFTGTISTVKVTTSGAKDIEATVSVTVGSTAFKYSDSESVSITATSTEYTFTGSASGTITITWENSSSKAIYFKVLGVTTLTSSGEQNIANVAAHKAAQRVAVKFANAFNTAMGTTANCTENMESAWATCSSAYNTFKSEAAALGEAEEAYAKNLIKYATLKEEWQQDYAPEDCIEKMVRVYKVCVESHGQTAFMNDLRPLQSRANIGFGVAMDSSSTSTIVIISALTGLAAIGGYFFLRKRKVQ